MAAYLYVLWAVDDELVKLGISKTPQKRVASHTGNSSNPLNYSNWKLYCFESIEDARAVETEVKKRLHQASLGFRDKQEIFRCPPTAVTKVVEDSCEAKGIQFLKNFPTDGTDALQTFGNFPVVPDYALEMLTTDQKSLYYQGAADALYCLSFFEGISFQRSDFLRLMGQVRERKSINEDLWHVFVDYFRNAHVSNQNNDERREVAERARLEISGERRFAFTDWQELPDDGDAEAA